MRFSRPVPFLLVLVVTGWSVVSAGINQDARFVLGSLSAGWPVGDAWAHRPLLFRVAMLPFAALGPTPVAEAAIRLLLLGAVVFASLVLGWGVSRIHTRPWWVAGVVGVSLAWAPGWDFAEPEWMATVFAVAGLGLALRHTDPDPQDPPAVTALAATLAPLLLACACLLKYTTATTAVVVWGLVWWTRGLSHSVRLAWRTLAFAASGLVITMLISRPEYLWLTEMSALNPTVDLGTPRELLEGLANLPLVAPITMVAVAVLLPLWRWRRLAVAGCVAAVGVLSLPFVLQHQNFLYHLAPIPVLCAGVVAAVVTHPRTAARMGPTAAVAGLGATSVATLLWFFPEPLRNRHWEFASLAMVAVVALTWLITLPRSARRLPRPGRHWLASGAMLTLLVPVFPVTAYSYSLAHRGTTNLDNRALAQPLEIPGVATDAPVVYLSFSAPYRMQNPSTCQYVSPTWLQRAGDREAVPDTRSFSMNLACLYDPDARFAIVESDWFVLADADPHVRTAVERGFDCTRPTGSSEGFIACPRR